MNAEVTDNELDSLLEGAAIDLESDSAPAAADTTAAAPRASKPDLSFFGKIPVRVTLEVASVEISLKDLMEVDSSSVIALDKAAGEPLDVKVNGSLFGKAEVVMMNGNYGLRIVELCGGGLADLNV